MGIDKAEIRRRRLLPNRAGEQEKLRQDLADLQQVCRDMFWFLVADGDVFGCACEKPIEKVDDECPPCRCRRVGAATGAFGPHEKAELASQRKRLNYVPKKGVR